MIIEERWPCPACGNRRTIQCGRQTNYCFNCGSLNGVRVRARSVWPTRPTLWTDAEIARLTIYRAAVRAGLYTDAVDAGRGGRGTTVSA
jgi:hypothetical protein